jgi:hypothetical protein
VGAGAPAADPARQRRLKLEVLDPRPVGRATLGPEQSEAFPGSGPVAFLEQVRAARHDGYCGSCSSSGGNAPAYRLACVDAPVRESASGKVVAVEGSAFLQITSPQPVASI